MREDPRNRPGTPDRAPDRMRKILNAERLRLQTRVRDLRKKADTDMLTGLSNRRAFEERMEGVFAKIREHREVDGVPIKRAAVIAFDIDHFKSINDTYGHDAGDEVLRAFGELLAKSFRAEDVVGRIGVVARMGDVARVGGEEFLAVMVGASISDAVRKAESLRAAFEGLTFHFGPEEQHFTVSLGVASTEDDGGPQLEAVVKKADLALYAAKDGGRNRVEVFEEKKDAA